MRRLMWLAIGFGTACALSVYVLSVSMLLWLGIPLAALGMIGLFLPLDSKGKIGVFLCFGLSIGFLWFHILMPSTLRPQEIWMEILWK